MMKLTPEVEQAAQELETAAQAAKAAREVVVDELQIDVLVDDFNGMDVTTGDVATGYDKGLHTRILAYHHIEEVTARKQTPTSVPGQFEMSPSTLFLAVKEMVEANRKHKVASDHFVAALGRSAAAK